MFAFDGRPAGFGIADGVVDPSARIAHRRHHVDLRQTPVVDSPRGIDEFLGPTHGFVLFIPDAEKPCVADDVGGGVEVVAVCGPPECTAQIRELDSQPFVGLPLAGPVPQRHDIGTPTGEVSGVCAARLIAPTGLDKLLPGELTDGLQHREPGSSR
ncbi:hypothetical protein [Mycobacterium sp. URHB0021]